jgi:hypothetical protein
VTWYPRGSLEERFWEKVDVNGPDDCWPWLGSQSGGSPGHRYGLIGDKGFKYYTHRLSWSWANQCPPESARVVRHTCDNTLCVNPRHLIEGTQADNIQDCSAKARIGHGERHYKAKVTDEQVRAIRGRYSIGERTVDLAAEYGISRSQVLRITNGTSRPRYINDL